MNRGIYPLASEIPEELARSLRLICDLDDSSFDALYGAILEHQYDADVEAMIESVAMAAAIDESVAHDITVLVAAMSQLADDSSAETLLARIETDIQNTLFFAQMPEAERQKLLRRLASLLKGNAVRYVSKIQDLLYDHERVFAECRIITDVRSVFDKPESPPIGAGFVHTLKVVYFEDFEKREWFVALNDDDIAMLQEQITRARTKVNSLKQVLKKADLQIFGSSEKAN